MEANTWIPCAVELPDADTTVLVSNPNWPNEPVWMGFYEDDHWTSAEGMWLDDEPDSGSETAEPTHWKHLPEPPEKEAR